MRVSERFLIPYLVAGLACIPASAVAEDSGARLLVEDRDSLLTPALTERIRAELQRHAGQSVWRVRVIIENNPALTVPVPGRGEVLVSYKPGQPDAAQILSDALVPLSEPVLDALRNACARFAQDASTADQQLIRFVDQLTQQMSRIEQALGPHSNATAPPSVSAAPASPAIQLLLLTKVAILFFLVAGVIAAWNHHLKRRRSSMKVPMRLPALEIHPRLGAPHGGGSQALMSFGNPGESSIAWRLGQRLKRLSRRFKRNDESLEEI